MHRKLVVVVRRPPHQTSGRVPGSGNRDKIWWARSTFAYRSSCPRPVELLRQAMPARRQTIKKTLGQRDRESPWQICQDAHRAYAARHNVEHAKGHGRFPDLPIPARHPGPVFAPVFCPRQKEQPSSFFSEAFQLRETAYRGLTYSGGGPGPSGQYAITRKRDRRFRQGPLAAAKIGP